MAIRPLNLRWGGDKKRPGVEARRPTGRGNWNASDARYIVVTAKCRSEHDSFDEAAEEYRIRRVSALTPTRAGVGENAG